MILSMTGYGKAESQLKEHRRVIVEVRSLNSKSLDLSMRLAPQLRAHELDIRTIISQRLERGKIDLSIYYQDTANPEAGMGFAPINREAFAYYYNELKELQQQYAIQNCNLLDSILRIPDVLKPSEDCAEAGEQEWEIVRNTLNQAIDAFLAFRKYDILPDKGRISATAAKQKAEEEYDEFNKMQRITSDFDREVQKLLEHEKRQ